MIGGIIECRAHRRPELADRDIDRRLADLLRGTRS